MFTTPLTRRQLLIGLAPGLIAAGSAGAQDFEGHAAIIFVGASWCPVCKTAAPMLALFCQTNAIPVLVASHDGRPIPPFESVELASTNPLTAPISVLPTTFVYSNREDRIVSAVEGYRNGRWYLMQLLAGVRHA